MHFTLLFFEYTEYKYKLVVVEQCNLSPEFQSLVVHLSTRYRPSKQGKLVGNSQKFGVSSLGSPAISITY